MAGNTSIEWTDATWNPVTGCSVVSPGCTNCYAMKLAGTRLKHIPSRAGLTTDSKAGPVWNGKVRLNKEWLDQPLRWKKPRMIFVCAHGDLFHEDVPDEVIDRVFAVMALCPQHTFQVLTKRSARMREYLTPYSQRRADGLGTAVLALGYDGPLEALRWPLPNVWLGVSAEDQARADDRIPDLLATPAAIRFVSAEPLLGSLNITAALRPLQPFCEQDLPDVWSEFIWPEWVPITVRSLVTDFWREQWGRGPKAWLRDAITQGGPALWSESSLRRLTVRGEPISGRFVHLWNNIGCVIHGDDSWTQGSFTGSGVYTSVVKNGRGLDWVIVGGESGQDARPMHPDWARSIRDQCAAAGVPFFFKQWGSWAHIPGLEKAPYRPSERLRDGGPKFQRRDLDGAAMLNLGKKAAGRLLDGIEHNGMPEIREVPAI